MRVVNLIILLLLNGCASEAILPENWAKPALTTAAGCQLPTGDFSNFGEPSDPDFTDNITLSSLLFNYELENENLDRIRIVETSEQTLKINALANDNVLDKEIILKPDTNKCSEERWFGSTSIDTGVAREASYFIIATGGILIPWAEWTRFYLMLAEDGDLLVHLQYRGLVGYTLLVPVPTTFDDVWIRYPRIDNLNKHKDKPSDNSSITYIADNRGSVEAQTINFEYMPMTENEKQNIDSAYEKAKTMILNWDPGIWEHLCRSANERHGNSQSLLADWIRADLNPPREPPDFRSGLIRDNRVAYMWYSQAELNGSRNAKYGKAYMAEKLSEQNLAEAVQMANNWQPGQCPAPSNP